MLLLKGCCSRGRIEQANLEHQAFGNEVVVFGLRVAELGNGVVWLGMVVSGLATGGISL